MCGRGVVITVVAIWALTTWLGGLARAADGDLDPTFNADGKLTTSFAEGEANARSVAIQPDGKIVVAGAVGSDFGLARYETDGSLDATFDGDGRVVTDLSGGLDAARGVAVQADGKIVAVGVVDQLGPDPTFGLVRYNDDGSLDPEFDDDGKVTTNFSGGEDTAAAVAIGSDGKIVVAGSKHGVAFAVARYTDLGSLDPTFGGDGRVTTTFHSLGIARGVAIQPNGKIVAVGTSASSGGFALARYRDDGSLDPRFGGDGKVLTYLADGYGGEAHSVALQSDGKVVIAGAGENDIFGPFAVARYTSRGRLDPTFSGDGIVTTDMGSEEQAADGVAIQGNGKIVAAGYADVPHEAGSSRGGFALARYRPGGALDASFGGDGKVRTRFRAGVALGICVALQGDGRIVAAGWVAGRFAVARYLN
jgi:uncharacterized delta-60 repeat protein